MHLDLSGEEAPLVARWESPDPVTLDCGITQAVAIVVYVATPLSEEALLGKLRGMLGVNRLANWPKWMHSVDIEDIYDPNDEEE